MNRSTQEYRYDQNEDDRFFAELQRQILILTADDDDDDYDISYGRRKFIKSRLRGANNASTSYFDWTKNEKNIYVSNSVPNYILNLWRNGNAAGTGVFIPDIVSSRKRNKQRRRKGDKGYIKPMENQQEASPPRSHGQ